MPPHAFSPMPHDLEFTGERFVPGVPGEIELEHVHRYAFARGYAAGKRVLDAACGEGYGSALLARAASQVVGVDIDPATLAHASRQYVALTGLAFQQASVTALPFADASFDLIVSFETIEHLEEKDQPRMLAEFARLLAPRGLLILSAPNRVEYSEKNNYHNPYHLHEHDRAELEALLATHFAARRFYHQRVLLGSSLWREEGGATQASYVGNSREVNPSSPPPAMYFLVMAARSAADLPDDGASLSLFIDPEEAELRRLASQVDEIRLVNARLAEVTASLEARTEHVLHLERMVAFRENLVVERDGQLQVRQAQLQACQAQLQAQEHIIDYRHTLGWWFKLPWLRLRGAWRRIV